MSIGETYRVAEVAQALQCSRWWVEKQVKLGRVTPMRLGDHARAPMRFTDEDIDQLKASLRPAAPVEGRKRRRRRAA